MAEKVVLNVEIRDEVGTKEAVKLRKQGKVPAIMYGHGEAPVALSLNLHDFTEALHRGHRIIDLKTDSKSETALVKDLQYDHLGKKIIHADFVRVDLAETVKVMVPIIQKGTALGTHQGGMVDAHLDSIEVECKVSEIPDTIEVSIKDLDVGDSIHAGEIELPEGAKLITNPETLVFNCHVVAAAKSTEEVEEEAPAAPEVITEKAEEPEQEKESK